MHNGMKLLQYALPVHSLPHTSQCCKAKASHDSRETLELYSDGQSALKLSQHVRGLAAVECPAANEQDVVCAHIAVLGLHYRALNDGQQVSLHTF